DPVRTDAVAPGGIASELAVELVEHAVAVVVDAVTHQLGGLGHGLADARAPHTVDALLHAAFAGRMVLRSGRAAVAVAHRAGRVALLHGDHAGVAPGRDAEASVAFEARGAVGAAGASRARIVAGLDL